MRLINLHYNLIRFLYKEIPKQKNLKELIYFLKKVGIQYFKVLLQDYRLTLSFFDPIYQEQKRKIKQYNQYKKDIKNAYRIIQWMIKQGENKRERKYIRRDFEKHGRLHKETEKMILKDIYGVKEE